MEELTTSQINIIALTAIYLFTVGGLIWRMANPKCRHDRYKERRIRERRERHNQKLRRR